MHGEIHLNAPHRELNGVKLAAMLRQNASRACSRSQHDIGDSAPPEGDCFQRWHHSHEGTAALGGGPC